MVTPIIITGPPTDKVSKEEAEAKLVRHPQFPKNASYTLEEVEGRWIAAIAPKQAAPPEAFADGGGAGDTPAGPPEPSEAPKGPPEDDASEDEPTEDEKPKDEKGDKGKGESEKGELGEIKEMLTLLVTALGLGAGPEDSPIPGADEGPPVPPEAGPPGPAGPPGEGGNKIRHERSLKPGEAPPGTTPIGAPSFAHVRDDHPWKSILGQKRTFKLEEPIGDEPISAVAAEVHALAAETKGYKVAQLKEARDDSGQRVARVLITAQ